MSNVEWDGERCGRLRNSSSVIWVVGWIGMVPFKNIFLGHESFPYESQCATSSQVRLSVLSCLFLFSLLLLSRLFSVVVSAVCSVASWVGS